MRGILAAPSITAPARLELESRRLEFREISALPEHAASALSVTAQASLFDV